MGFAEKKFHSNKTWMHIDKFWHHGKYFVYLTMQQRSSARVQYGAIS